MKPLIAVALAVLVLSGCGDAWSPDYSGDNNKFTVAMDVVEVGSQSVRGEVVRIDEANGRADGWFEIGNTHRIHDNCDCHGFWLGRKQYGEVFDYDGYQITLDDLSGQECLLINGRIRSNNEGKTWDDRPVFDRAQVTTCG